MTAQERAQALVEVGLTPRQATFVALAALVGGHCLRRQYQAFTGLAPGATVREFTDGLVTRGWAQRLRFRADRAHVYHLSGKHLYATLGDPDNRNRRPAPAHVVARRLMLLDVVLSHADWDWYLTEADKVGLCERFGIPQNCLPRRVYRPTAREATSPSAVRAFIDKQPLAVSDAGIHVIYVTTDPSARSFERWLHDYAPLLTRLPQWSVIVTYPPTVRTIGTHRHVFERWYLELPRRTTADDVAWAVRTHRELTEAARRVDTDTLHRLQDIVADVTPAVFADICQRVPWERSAWPAWLRTNVAFSGRIDEHVVRDSYDLFGGLPGAA